MSAMVLLLCVMVFKNILRLWALTAPVCKTFDK